MNTPVSILTMVFKPHSKRKPKKKKRLKHQRVLSYGTCYYYASQQLTREYSPSEWQPNYGNTYDKKHSKAPPKKTEQIGHHTCILRQKISRFHYVTSIYK